jgi:hypothetical protein
MTDDKKPQLTIPLEDLIRILQLNNPDLYETAEKDQKEFMISNFRFVVRSLLGDGVVNELSEAALDQSRIGFFGSKNGCAIAYMFLLGDEETPDRIILCGFDMAKSTKAAEAEGQFAPSPYFCFDADFDIEGLLSINHFAVLTNDEGNTYSILEPDNQLDICGFMLYMNYLFVNMVRNNTISLTEAETMVSDDFIANKAGFVYKNIKSRNTMDVYYLRRAEIANDVPLDLPTSEYHRIFQTDNPDLFEPIAAEDIPAITEYMAEIMGGAGSDYAHHFQDLKNAYETPPIFRQNNFGDQIWHFAYSREDDFGVSRDYMLMLVINFEAIPDTPQTIIRPIAILMGELSNSSMFEPLEQIGYVTHHNKTSYQHFRDPKAYMRLACLIEAALEFVMLDERLEDEVLCEWLTTIEFEEVSERYEFIASRNTDGLYRNIQDISEKTDEVYTVRHHPRPPTIQ